MSNHTPNLAAAREVFVDGAQGEFVGEDFDRLIAAVRAEERERAAQIAESLDPVELVLAGIQAGRDIAFRIRGRDIKEAKAEPGLGSLSDQFDEAVRDADGWWPATRTRILALVAEHDARKHEESAAAALEAADGRIRMLHGDLFRARQERDEERAAKSGNAAALNAAVEKRDELAAAVEQALATGDRTWKPGDTSGFDWYDIRDILADAPEALRLVQEATWDEGYGADETCHTPRVNPYRKAQP